MLNEIKEYIKKSNLKKASEDIYSSLGVKELSDS